MKNLYWLIKRELWEHKVEFVWAPLALGMLFVGLAATWTFISSGSIGHMNLVVDGQVIDLSVALPSQVLAIIDQPISIGMNLSAMITAVMSGFVIANYSAGSLFHDRKDRSILFWKSLPISDRETVISKAVVAIFVVPLITLLAIVISLLLMGLIGVWGVGGSANASAISHLIWFRFTESTLKILTIFPAQLVFLVPSVGWFMLVSSIARANPSLWALGIPSIAMVILSNLLDWSGVENVGHSIRPLTSVLLGFVPTGSSIMFADSGSLELTAHLREAIFDPQLLPTVAAGGVMIWLAIWIRQRSDDI